MKGKTKKWLARGGFAALVAVAMAFAGPREAAAFTPCGPGEEFLGTCPPYTHVTCESECFEKFQIHGSQCMGGETDRCCVCLL
jgi:hypothetical protein